MSSPKTRRACSVGATSYAAWRAEPEGSEPQLEDCDARAAREVCRRALAARGAGWLEPDEVRAVLSACGLPLVSERFADTADDAVRAAQEIGHPVALKLVAKDVVHKSDLGGVALDLADADGVRVAFSAMAARLEAVGRAAAFQGVVVQQMVPGGIEVLVGATEDEVFGPLVVFGLGGIHVEVLGDVVFRVAPITDKDAREMLRAIRGRKLLEGYRGRPPADEAAIEDILLRISRLVTDVPEIDDLDVNPVLALAPGEGCCVLDARIHVARPAASTPATR